MPAPDRQVGRLKRRPEFLAVAGTRRKHVAPGLILQVRRHDDRQRPANGEPPIRIGLTASRKVGNAVVRNRARRRLREAARQILPQHAVPGHDFVLVARGDTAERPWADLVSDLKAGLKRLGLWRDVKTQDSVKTGDSPSLVEQAPVEQVAPSGRARPVVAKGDRKVAKSGNEKTGSTDPVSAPDSTQAGSPLSAQSSDDQPQAERCG